MNQESGNNGNGAGREDARSFEIKVGLAEMLKGGVIMDVTTPEQAKIAEDAGAAAVMALERVPANLLEASGDLGASPGQTFRHVILPLALPGVFAGSISPSR